MTIKNWNGDNDAHFEDLVTPIVKAIKFAYKLQRKNLYKDIPYNGYDRPSMLHVCFPIEQTLSREHLKDSQQNALETLVGLAVQLGIEQGRRSYKKREMKHDLLIARLEGIKEYYRETV